MKRIATSIAMLALAIAAPAHAALVRFVITGGYQADFLLDLSPVVNPFAADPGIGFVLTGVPGFPDATNGTADVSFYNSDALGGMIIEDQGVALLLNTFGPQLYSGPESAPTFLTSPDSYTLFDFDDSSITYSLTISEVTAVPEPASWAMMIAGLTMAGGALRRNRTSVVTTVNA